MEFGARSDTGRVRENNEDSFGLAPELNLFVLSDGMGGLESGERASRLAVETVIAHCRDAETNPALAVLAAASKASARFRIGSPAPCGSRIKRFITPLKSWEEGAAWARRLWPRDAWTIAYASRMWATAVRICCAKASSIS